MNSEHNAETAHGDTQVVDHDHGHDHVHGHSHDSGHDHDADHGKGHGLTDQGYVVVALILAAITAAEVSLTYIDVGALFMPALLIMMVAKFVIVVSFFMHLRFDNKIFTWLFYTGLLLAVGVYSAALLTFQFFAST